MRRSETALALALAALGLAACDDGIDIIGECTVGDVRRVTDVPLEPSVGLLDGRVFVSLSAEVPAEDLTVRRSEHYGLWLDEELEAASELLWLGSGLHSASRALWLRHEGALVAHIWSRPEPPPPWSEETISLWTVTLPPEAQAAARPIHLEVPPPVEGDPSIRAFGMGVLFQPAEEQLFPAAATASDVVGTLVAAPLACGERYGNYDRLHLFSLEQTTAFPVLWGDAACEGELYDFSMAVATPWLYAGGDGRLSVLFRAGAADDGHVRLLRLNDDLTIRDGPRVVGGVDLSSSGIDGFQPRAVAVPGGRVLFLERISGGNDCHVLRIMNEDGECAEDAPWQLPCYGDGGRYGDRDLITGYLELVSVPGGAVVVWGQHTNPHELRVHAGIDYREGIYATLLTPEGRRGSAIVEVTDPGATALPFAPRPGILGPYPVKPIPSAASEGDDLVVAWPDRREHAPGVYLRRLTCTVLRD